MVDQTSVAAMLSHHKESNKTVNRSGSVASGRSSKRSKRNARRRRARQWTCVIESFKHSTDLLYDFCHKEHSIDGCKEIIILLKNSVHDFTALINSIQVEEKWDPEKKPYAVAWEIRKTMSSPHAIKEKLTVTNAGQSLLQELPLSSIVLPSSCVNLVRQDDTGNEDGWQLVRRRRRSVSSVTSQSIDGEREKTLLEEEKHVSTAPKQTVYDRLYSSAVNRDRSQSHPLPSSSSSSGTLSKAGLVSGRLMSPRCAMDLPQTKASMAKIAYSRQKLWQRAQSSLAEKLKARQKQQRIQEMDRRNSSRCGINFADPVAVRKSAGEYNLKQRQKRQVTPGSEVRSLGSIRETAEDADAIPLDPKPSMENALEKEGYTVVTSPVSFSNSSWHGIELTLMECEDEWKVMTEEEESLAQEERSLTREIENEERMSIDDELERQVAAEAEDLEIMESQAKKNPRSIEDPSSYAPKSWNNIVEKWEKELKMLASVSWNEIVEKEMIGHYREPGDGAVKHEKLSSLSRLKRSSHSDLQKRHELKQQRADVLRQKLLDEKAARLRELGNKIAEVRARQAEIREKKMEHYFSKLKKADENRNRNLAEIVKRAKEDDQKVQEVNFINSLEADLFAMDKIDKEIAREKEMERRREQLADERARRQEEKAAKEQKAEERRRHAEQERVARIQERVEHKAVREAQLEAMREEQERERKERRRLREERHEVNKAAVVEKRENLWKQKQIKLDSSNRRHLYCLEAVSTKTHQLASPNRKTRWSTLLVYTAWPTQTTKRPWLCLRCNVKLSCELDSIAHVFSLSHLNTWKMKTYEVTHHKLEKELSEILIECDPCNSLVTSSGEEVDCIDKKKRHRQKQKIMNRLKKCTEAVVSSLRYKDTKNNTIIDRQIRELITSLLTNDEKLFDLNVGEVVKKLKATPTLENQVITSGLGISLIEKMIKNDQPSKRFFSRMSTLLCDLCQHSHLVATYSLISTQLSTWFSESLYEAIKNSESFRLSSLVSMCSLVLKQCQTVNDLQKWGMDNKEIPIRTDMIASYLLAMDVPPLLYSFVISQFDLLMSSSECIDNILSPIQNIADWVIMMAKRTDTQSVQCLVDIFTDSLLFGMVGILRSETNNGRTSRGSYQTVSRSDFIKRICSICLDFFTLLPNGQFKSTFSTSDPRSFRFSLFLSDVIRLPDNQSSEDRMSIDFRSVALTGKFATVGPIQQLLCIRGCSRSIVCTLSLFPLFFFVSDHHAHLLLSALIAISYNLPQAVDQIKQNMSTKFLTRFLENYNDSSMSSDSCFLKSVLRDDLRKVVKFFDPEK